MKSFLKRSVAIVLLISILSTLLCANAFAANVCNQVSGNLNSNGYFIVTTGRGWLLGQTITLSQNKGIAVYRKAGFKKYTTSNIYGHYKVSVRLLSGNGDTPKPFVWYGANCKIRLGKNSKYLISIIPIKNNLEYVKLPINFLQYWKKLPTWSVKKTRNISLCV